jgi:hypothetical protein
MPEILFVVNNEKKNTSCRLLQMIMNNEKNVCELNKLKWQTQQNLKKKNYSYSDRLKTNSNFSAISAIALELLAQGNARKGVFQSARNRTLNLFPILHFLQTK